MAKQRYFIINGIFTCQKCEAEVYTSRYYQEAFECTWMCEKKHLSKVSLYHAKGY